ncbi:hypothetical protein ASG25_02865 [Rhizobium sp. Leaf384]|nr:hypothetical protein ASG25_02865 [Rhizobium sp. Leaf384]KQS86595.1 hypothetical protein ASG58_17940 [Rhizobium sp. Leaf383]
MRFELIVIVAVETLDGCFLDCSVHSLDLSIGPWVLHLCQPVFDILLHVMPGFVSCAIDLPAYPRPLNRLKKLSATALSLQLPRRLIE